MSLLFIVKSFLARRYTSKSNTRKRVPGTNVYIPKPKPLRYGRYDAEHAMTRTWVRSVFVDTYQSVSAATPFRYPSYFPT
eukprot:2941004-Rhodomonas_salina.1